MAAADTLAELRQVNKSLLERLARKREEFRKRNPADGRTHTMRGDRTGARACKEHPPWIDSMAASSTSKPVPGLSSIASKALATAMDPVKSHSSTPRQPDAWSSRGLHNGAPENHLATGRDVIKIQSSSKCLSVPHSTIARPPATPPGAATRTSGQYVEHLMHEGNLRSPEPRTPKSILVTPRRSTKKDPGRVTFLSSSAVPHAEQWSGRPLLGYDWIAGLLEADSPFSDKPDQFFSEINEFRRVNKEECVRDSFTGSEAQEDSGSEEDLDTALDTHQCVYCYRVNSRLFTSLAGAEAACPICKKRRGRRRAALEEPAYVRVSIPRSTLLPPYKYRAHRRKSFDPTDTLALPSHCLSGWENAMPSCNLRVTSLDLKTSVEPSMVTAASSVNVGTDSASFYASRARSENLLNASRSISFHHNKGK